MACGCVVVASDTGICRQVLEASGTGHVLQVANTAMLAAALRTLTENPDVATHFGEQGRRHIEEEYLSALEAISLEKTYQIFWGWPKVSSEKSTISSIIL
jgi:glycosyltransferase involved in cell wall biosynthesis